MSQLTDTLTKISRDFVFDRLLWASEVYKDASPGLLGLMRERVRRREQAPRSKAIEERLKKDSAFAEEVVKTLVISSDKSQVDTFINVITWKPDLQGRYYDAEDMQNIIGRAVTTLADMSRNFILERGLAIEDYFAKLDVESQTQSSADRTKARAQSLQSLWSNETFKIAMLKEGDYFPSWAEWYFSPRNRICSHS